MKKILKRIVCLIRGHDWEVAPGQNMFAAGIPWFVCKRCGKMESTL